MVKFIWLKYRKKEKKLFSTKERDISTQQLDLFPVGNSSEIEDLY